MSSVGTIVDKFATIITASVSGVTISKEASSIEGLAPENFPYCILVATDYSVDILDWKQERRSFTVTGALFVDSESATRETVQAHLDAIRTAVSADPTLTSSVDDARLEAAVAADTPDSPIHAGDFELTAEVVV